MADQPDIQATPVIRRDMPEGVIAAIDAEGHFIVDEWVTVRCVGCGATGSAPKKLAQRFTPDPATGDYSALCGTCIHGQPVNYYGPGAGGTN